MFNDSKEGRQVGAGGVLTVQAPNGSGQVLYVEKVSGAGSYPIMVYRDANKVQTLLHISGPGQYEFSEPLPEVVIDFTPGGGVQGDVWIASMGAKGDRKPDPKSTLPEGWVLKASQTVSGTGAANQAIAGAPVAGAAAVIIAISNYTKPAGAPTGTFLGFKVRENGNALGQNFFRQWEAIDPASQSPAGISPLAEYPANAMNAAAVVYLAPGIQDRAAIPVDVNTEGEQSGLRFDVDWPLIGDLQVVCQALNIAAGAGAWSVQVDVFARYV